MLRYSSASRSPTERHSRDRDQVAIAPEQNVIHIAWCVSTIHAAHTRSPSVSNALWYVLRIHSVSHTLIHASNRTNSHFHCLGILYVTLASMGVLFNACFILLVVLSPQLRKLNHFLLVGQAFIDLLYCIVGLVFHSMLVHGAGLDCNVDGIYAFTVSCPVYVFSVCLSDLLHVIHCYAGFIIV